MVVATFVTVATLW